MKVVGLNLLLMLLVSACGYKGDLYLPKETDDARFGVIQTEFGQSKSKSVDDVKNHKEVE